MSVSFTLDVRLSPNSIILLLLDDFHLIIMVKKC